MPVSGKHSTEDEKMSRTQLLSLPSLYHHCSCCMDLCHLSRHCTPMFWKQLWPPAEWEISVLSCGGKRGGHGILGNAENPEKKECSVNIYCFKLKRAISLKEKTWDFVLRIEQEKHRPSAFSWEMNFIRVTVIVYCPHWCFWLGWDPISTSVLTVGTITSLCVTFGKKFTMNHILFLVPTKERLFSPVIFFSFHLFNYF